MSASTIILRTELLRMVRGRWLLPLWLAFLALCGYAAWEGAAWSAQRGAALAAIQDEEREVHRMRRAQIVDELTPENKSRYGGAIYATAMSFRATLPQGELPVLSAGQAEGYPMAAKISPFVASNTIFDAYMAGMENPAVLAAGRFDLADRVSPACADAGAGPDGAGRGRRTRAPDDAAGDMERRRMPVARHSC